MAVELAAREESARRAGRAPRPEVGEPLRLPRRPPRAAAAHQPAEPQPGRERLARGAGVDHVLGREPLERPDRLAVVAELGVVIVLDQSAPVARPAEQRRPPLRRSTPPVGNWCAAVTTTASEPRRSRALDGEAVARRPGAARPRGPRRATIARYSRVGRVLDGEPPRAAARSAARDSPRPCANPVQMTTSAGRPVPRTRSGSARAPTRSSGNAAAAEVRIADRVGRFASAWRSAAATPRAGTPRRRAGRDGSRTRTTAGRAAGARAAAYTGGDPGRAARPAPRGSPRRRAARTPRRRSRARRRAAPASAAGRRQDRARRVAARRGSPHEVRLELAVQRLRGAAGRAATSSSTSELVLDLVIGPDLSRGPVIASSCGYALAPRTCHGGPHDGRPAAHHPGLSRDGDLRQRRVPPRRGQPRRRPRRRGLLS